MAILEEKNLDQNNTSQTEVTEIKLISPILKLWTPGSRRFLKVHMQVLKSPYAGNAWVS